MEKQDQRDKNRTGENKMIIPIRCFSCGKPLAHLWEEFSERRKKEEVKKILDSLKLERYCCRAALMSHVDLIDTVARFRKS